MDTFSASKVADDLIETFRNGNRKDVLEALDLLPQDQALAVVAYMVQALWEAYRVGDYNAKDDATILLRLLSDRL
jgi:hypothetical protein